MGGLGLRVEGFGLRVLVRTERDTIHEVFRDRKSEREVWRRVFNVAGTHLLTSQSENNFSI